MDEFFRHYIVADDTGRIIDGWSDGPHPHKITTGAICINEEGGYQFRLFPDGEENPMLFEENGIPLYKWDGEQVLARTQEEIEEDIADLPKPEPTQLDRIEAAVNKSQQDIIDAYTLELMEGGII